MTDPLAFKTTMEFEYGVPREMAPGVVRLVANNPSPFTFKGTNTYLIGSKTLAVIDPGPHDAAHCAAILAAAGKRPTTHILLTHTHRDHFDGLPALLAATGATTAGYGRYDLTSKMAARGGLGGGPGGEGSHTERSWTPDIVLREGSTLAGGDWAVTAIHTPGHTPDHLSFALQPTTPGVRVLFPGDHIMAWNTSVVAPPEGRMADYLASLERLMARDDTIAFPGHGGQYETPARVAKAYLIHRRMRDAAILEAIRNGATTVAAVVAQIYKGLDQRLVPAASMSALAHIEHQIERGLVTASAPFSLASVLSAV
jgi:glyoxylase-like metal-dependent hydrolase (beta-lactamase superfamily II)